MSEEYKLEGKPGYNDEIWYPLTNYHACSGPKKVKVIADCPPHEPTKYDLERIAKAKALRERRAKAHFRQHTQQL